MDLDTAIDELYGLPLGDFVAGRTRLAKELRAADDDVGAQTIAKLRKPTVAAWVLNQLARRDRRGVDLLLDAGHRLLEAQTGALSGEKREGFEEARKIESQALRTLLRAARELLAEERGAASTTILDQVEQTLRAAAISGDGRELLARGQFVEPLQSSGFDVVSGLAPPARRPASPRHDKRREATAALDQAKAALREAEQVARTAERSAERLRAELERADRAVEAARAKVEAAARAVEDAQRRVDELGRR